MQLFLSLSSPRASEPSPFSHRETKRRNGKSQRRCSWDRSGNIYITFHSVTAKQVGKCVPTMSPKRKKWIWWKARQSLPWGARGSAWRVEFQGLLAPFASIWAIIPRNTLWKKTSGGERVTGWRFVQPRLCAALDKLEAETVDTRANFPIQT